MALRLPRPMLAQRGQIPAGPGWSFELKWDGFRAIVGRNEDFRVRSRRGWDVPLLPQQNRTRDTRRVDRSDVTSIAAIV